MPGAFLPEKVHGVNAIIPLKNFGAESGKWNAAIAGGKCAVGSGASADQAAMTLAADAGDYVKLFSGELDGMQGKLKLGGDLNLAMKLLLMFKLK